MKSEVARLFVYQFKVLLRSKMHLFFSPHILKVLTLPSSMLKLPNQALDSIAHKDTTNKLKELFLYFATALHPNFQEFLFRERDN